MLPVAAESAAQSTSTGAAILASRRAICAARTEHLFVHRGAPPCCASVHTYADGLLANDSRWQRGTAGPVSLLHMRALLCHLLWPRCCFQGAWQAHFKCSLLG